MKEEKEGIKAAEQEKPKKRRNRKKNRKNEMRKSYFAGMISMLALVMIVLVGTTFLWPGSSADHPGGFWSWRKTAAIKAMISQLYAGDVDDTELSNAMYKGMISGLGDKYSTYYTKEEYEAIKTAQEGYYQGIGVKLKASLQPLLQGTTDNLGGSRSVPVECVIHLGERLSNPSIGFDVRVPGSDPETRRSWANALSTPETVDTQFAYLLLFNSFMAESSSLASSNIGSSVSAATGMEFLSNMVSSWFSSLGYDFRIGYRPRSEQASDEVDFGISKSLINDRLFVEVEGNYLLEKQAGRERLMSNFMAKPISPT